MPAAPLLASSVYSGLVQSVTSANSLFCVRKNVSKSVRSSFLCSMIWRSLVVVFLLFFCSFVTRGQSFISSRTALYKAAAEQKVCVLFEQQNPSIFSQAWSSTVSSPDVVLKKLLPDYANDFSPEEQREFSATFSSTQLAHQKALLDFYGPLLERKLLLHQLPGVLKYLPTALTGNCASYTDAFQRRGMWALSYPIAQKYRLRVDSLIDERCGGDLTTEAAARYLSDLNQLFPNDLARVLLAYWKSPAYVLSLAENGTSFASFTQEEDKSFIRYFMYVSTLLHQLPLPNALEAYFDVYGAYRLHFFERTVSFRSLQQVYGLSVEELRSINPVYIGEKIDSSYRRLSFLLPTAASERFSQNGNELYNYKEKLPVIDVVDEFVYHRVKSGETLGGIAKKYRVSVNQIKAWNNLKRTTIRKGQNLKIRQHKRVVRAVEITQPLPTPVLPSTPADTAVVAPIITPKVEVKPPQPKSKTHTVKEGESLWLIAKKYKTTPEKLMKLNGIGEHIRPGQKLKIPQ
jgi:membrane-bound lytic murein transglycosylase D